MLDAPKKSINAMLSIVIFSYHSNILPKHLSKESKI